MQYVYDCIVYDIVQFDNLISSFFSENSEDVAQIKSYQTSLQKTRTYKSSQVGATLRSPPPCKLGSWLQSPRCVSRHVGGLDLGDWGCR